MSGNEPDPGDVGLTIHAVSTITLQTSTRFGSTARLLTYGDEAVLTQEVIDANRDRFGRCALLDLLDIPGGPIRRGPWPAGVDRIEEGSPAWDDRRTAALRAAALLPDPEQQRIAAAEVRERYGSSSGARSHTIATFGQAR